MEKKKRDRSFEAFEKSPKTFGKSQKNRGNEKNRKRENSSEKVNAWKRDKGLKKVNAWKKEKNPGKEKDKKVEKEFWKPGNMLYPLPAVLVSCQRPGEKPNILTIAWTATICSNPAMISVSIRPERHSYEIIRETREFVVNLTTKELTLATDLCGVRSGKEIDKFETAHLTPGKCQKISAPLIMESPVNMECRVKKMIPLGSHVMFIAEVLGVHVSKEYLNEKGSLQLQKTGLMAYSHGEYYELGRKIGSFGYSVQKKSMKAKRHSNS